MNTAAVKSFVEKNGIVTLKADKTRPSPEIDALLRVLGNTGGAIPFYAIFPAGQPNNPIVFDGVFTSPATILAKLRDAGPSSGFAQVARTAAESQR